MFSICPENDAILCLLPTAVRLNIVLSLHSGKKVQSWQNTPPYIRLSELQIQAARKSYNILKQTKVIEDHDRIWQEGEGYTVELTMVVCCEASLELNLYLCLGIDDDYTALFWDSCVIAAVSPQMPARHCLEKLYDHLLCSDDEAARHLVALLKEDLRSSQVLRRDFLQFARRAKNECNLGHVKAVAMLNEDNRFALRMKTEYFLLIDEPTPGQLQAARHTILDLPIGDV